MKFLIRTRRGRDDKFAPWPCDDIALQRVCNYAAPPIGPVRLREILDAGKTHYNALTGSSFTVKDLNK